MTLPSQDFAPFFRFGTSSSETLTGTLEQPYLVGLGGNDTLVGTTDDDFLVGDFFNLTLLDAWNDLGPYPSFDYSQRGNDSLTGGDGNDFIVADQGNDTLDGGDGDDIFEVWSADMGTDVFRGGAGYDTLVFSDDWNLGLMFVTTSRLTLTSAEAVEEVDFGGLGLRGTEFNDVYNLSGVTLITYAPPGTQGRKTLMQGGDDLYTGAMSTDSVDGGTGNDSLTGNAGADVLWGGDGVDTLLGGNGNDTMIGGTGNDQLTGGSNGDSLDGGQGTDTLTGGMGNDIYVLESLTDTIVELDNEGIDMIATSMATFSLAGFTTIEKLRYDGTANFLGTGNGANNLILGNVGNDTLNGGLGMDTLNGGLGFDTIVFNTALGADNVDRLNSFGSPNDTIWLENTGAGLFNALTLGTLADSAFKVTAGTGAAAVDDDDRILYDRAAGFLYYDPDGSGDQAAVLFATFAPGLYLAASDFVII